MQVRLRVSPLTSSLQGRDMRRGMGWPPHDDMKLLVRSSYLYFYYVTFRFLHLVVCLRCLESLAERERRDNCYGYRSLGHMLPIAAPRALRGPIRGVLERRHDDRSQVSLPPRLSVPGVRAVQSMLALRWRRGGAIVLSPQPADIAGCIALNSPKIIHDLKKIKTSVKSLR